MRIVLTGFMGTGKTAVGQRVAQRLGRPFADTDALVEVLAGKAVRRIFADEGEDRFRELEREAVARACALRAQPHSRTSTSALAHCETHLDAAP